MHIGLLGGSFNPPHIGHVLVVRQVLDFTPLNKIWLLPAYRHTFDKPLAPHADRLAMTKLITEDRVEVSALEIDNQLDGNTINLVPILKKRFMKDKFTFIIGSDQLSTFTKWGEWRTLLKLLNFLVVPRAGYPQRPLYQNMKVLKHPLLVTTNISSSMVRQRVKKGLPIAHFVPKTVETYIKKKGLYI